MFYEYLSDRESLTWAVEAVANLFVGAGVDDGCLSAVSDSPPTADSEVVIAGR